MSTCQQRIESCWKNILCQLTTKDRVQEDKFWCRVLWANHFTVCLGWRSRHRSNDQSLCKTSLQAQCTSGTLLHLPRIFRDCMWSLFSLLCLAQFWVTTSWSTTKIFELWNAQNLLQDKQIKNLKCPSGQLVRQLLNMKHLLLWKHCNKIDFFFFCRLQLHDSSPFNDRCRQCERRDQRSHGTFVERCRQKRAPWAVAQNHRYRRGKYPPRFSSNLAKKMHFVVKLKFAHLALNKTRAKNSPCEVEANFGSRRASLVLCAARHFVHHDGGFWDACAQRDLMWSLR